MAIFGYGFDPAMTELLRSSSRVGVPVAASAIRAGPGGTAVIDCSQHGGFSNPSHRGPTQLGVVAPAGHHVGLPWVSGGAVVRPCGESRSYAGVLPTRTSTPPPVAPKPKAEPVRNAIALVYFQYGKTVFLMMFQVKKDTVEGACSFKAGYSTLPVFPIEKKHQFPSDKKEPPSDTISSSTADGMAKLLNKHIPCISSSEFRENMKNGVVCPDSKGEKNLLLVCDMTEEKFYKSLDDHHGDTHETMPMRSVLLPEVLSTKKTIMHLVMNDVGKDLPFLDIEPRFRQIISESFSNKDGWLR